MSGLLERGLLFAVGWLNKWQVWAEKGRMRNDRRSLVCMAAKVDTKDSRKSMQVDHHR